MLHNRTDDAGLSAALHEAESLGHHEGRNAGAWAVDGNTTTREAEAILDALTEGSYWDTGYAAPLSGEWADSRTPRDLYEDCTGRDAHADATYNADAYDSVLSDLCDEYEQAWFTSYEATVTNAARYLLAQD